MDVMIDQCDPMDHRNVGYLILVWNFGQGTKAKGEGCHVFLPPRQIILANVFLLIFEQMKFNMIKECVVPIGFNKDNSKKKLMLLIQHCRFNNHVTNQIRSFHQRPSLKGVK
jgi:hypothetical protein